PQIEVGFDIDANGILNVSAKNKATGKSQSIVIKASSGLSEDEVQRMVKDAEAHAEEDRKFHALVAARNYADNLIHATTKSMTELGEKVEPEEKSRIETAIQSLQEAMKTDDAEAIEAKTKDLSEASGKLAERVYAQKEETAHAGAGADAGGGTEQKEPGEVVDAEFEEVKENKK
ncbi:MAG TPA: Hsp70 family protein, partial [Gammaproteobacteria bacterium]|nr:Hsp70 family protein [Gammaproteobacteria bacterium]